MRILHTMLRVGDLQRSVKFYTDVLGMKLLRTTDRPEQKYSLAFVGYDDEERARGARAHLQLRRRALRPRRRLRAHRDRSARRRRKPATSVRRHGGKVTREAGPVKGGTTVIAFVEDPDGYKIEFIEQLIARSPQARDSPAAASDRSRRARNPPPAARCAASCAAPRTPAAAGLRRSPAALASGSRRTTADSTFGGGRNAPFDDVEKLLHRGSAPAARPRGGRRPRVEGAATMRSTTSSCSMKCMSRTRSA